MKNLLQMKPVKKQSIKIAIIFVTLITSVQNSYSQYEYTKAVNNQLRNMFSQITYPDSKVEFLYQRSAKFTDSSFWGHDISDTIQTTLWNQVYKEMYYAAHDTGVQSHPDIVDSIATSNYGDTINFGIMHWNFYKLKNASLHTGSYFVFDTVNDILYDHNSPVSSPYILDSLFMAAPLKEEASFRNVVYRIDPSLIFTDGKTYSTLESGHKLEIDFGDGIGFRIIDPTIENLINVSYNTNGEKIIKTKITENNSTRSSFSSTSRTFIKYNEYSEDEDYFITDIPGINVAVYKACQQGKMNKKIILLKGIDTYAKVPSKKTDNSYYYDALKRKKLHHLRNYGYDIYIVDWDDSRVDVRLNAYSLLTLIEKLKMEDVAEGNEQEYVFIGVSLGGIIAKYTINYMESDHYQNDDYEPFFVEADEQEAKNHMWQYRNFKHSHYNYTNWNRYKRKVMKHNARLLITIDSPHQGANIPLSVQHVLRLGKKVNSVFPLASDAEGKAAVDAKLAMIDKKATKQLLKYWVGSSSISNSSINYAPNYSYNTLFNQINFDNGGNPEYCKVVALSDGAMDGTPQQDINTDTDRTPGDKLIDMDHNRFIYILDIKLNLVHAKALIKTNPIFSSTPQDIVKVEIGRTRLQLELYWFGIRVNKIFIKSLTFAKKANNVHPYCTAAGGIREDLSDAVTKTDSVLSLKKEIIWGANTIFSNAEITTDGFHYCFIPIESALNYNGALPYNNDILNEPIVAKMNNTPFDVIAGNVYPRQSVGLADAHKEQRPNTLSKSYWLNTEHAWIRNDKDLIYNMTQATASYADPDSDEKFAFHSCAEEDKHSALRTFLSLEIGDEEMYLENFYTDRRTSYRPEYNVKVNVRNPYYDYQFSGYTNLRLGGVFSKENPFNIKTNDYGYPGHATFYYDVSSFLPSASPAPATAGLHISNSVYISPPSYSSQDTPYLICCDKTEGDGGMIKKQQLRDLGELSLYPNPNSENGMLWIKALLPAEETSAVISIYSVTGEQLYTLPIPKPKGTIQLEKLLPLSRINLASGVYVIKLDSKSKSISKQLVIQ